jgi:hypothetical protein
VRCVTKYSLPYPGSAGRCRETDVPRQNTDSARFDIEPTDMALLGLALGAFALTRRRKA